MKQDNPRPVAATLSKPEAVWRAIEALGARADVTEILEYVRTQFGITADSDAPAEAPAAPPAMTTPPAPAPAPPPPAATQAETPPSEPVRKPASQKKPRPRNDSAD